MKYYADHSEKAIEMGANDSLFVRNRHSIEGEIQDNCRVAESLCR